MTTYPNFFDVTAKNAWEELLPPHNPRRILQLGVFTGDASVWLLKHIDPELLVDVDCWNGGSSVTEGWMKDFDWTALEAHYDERTGEFQRSGQLVKEKTTTRDYLATALAGDIEPFDMVYIDADHTTAATLENAVMSYPLLAINGLMIFDDYTWSSGSGRLLDDPMPAIDAFKYMYIDRMKFLSLGNQYWLQKMR